MPDSSDFKRARKSLRRRMRQRRRGLDVHERIAAQRALIRAIRSLSTFRRARRIGVYLAFDGEPNLDALIRAALKSRKQLFVPVLRGLEMYFAPLPAAGSTRHNFFGILEPKNAVRAETLSLDLVLTPLVAFDDLGTRIGVGRGYYDRCFAFLRHRRTWIRPKLLGIAYGFQQVPRIEKQPWDIPLWGVATEHGVQVFAPRAE